MTSTNVTIEKLLTLKAINDLLTPTNENCKGQIAIESKIAWTYLHNMPYDTLMDCPDCDLTAETIYIQDGDLQHDALPVLKEWVIVQDTINRKSRCGSHRFSPLIKTRIENTYIMHWSYYSLFERAWSVFLLMEIDGRFQVVRELEGRVIHD